MLSNMGMDESAANDSDLTIAHTELLTLADFLQDQRFCTRVLESWLMLLECPKSSKRLTSWSEVADVYKNTLEGSNLRKFLVDLYIARCYRPAVANRLHEYPPGFMFDVAKQLALAVPTTGYDLIREKLAV